jgi:hypothetical protein
MATVTTKTITPAQLTTSPVAYLTVPANSSAVIKKLTFTNSTGVAQTVTAYLVPSGGGPTAGNILISARTVSAGDTYDCFEAQGQTLQTAGTLQIKSDANSAITVNGAYAQVE